MFPFHRSAALQSLAVLAACFAGCARVFLLEEVDDGPCGDGELLANEECDDGSGTAGDGCGATCQIEPGFECPTMNQACLPVLGLSRAATSTLLDAAGMNTGNAFTFTCPPDEVVIGFEGYANAVGDNLGSIRAVCASLGLTPTTDVLLTRSSQSEFFGGSQIDPLLTVLCGQDEVAVGFVPTTNTYVSGFQWICQQLSHAGGALQFGASRLLSFGPSMGIEETKRSCSQTEVVSSIFGTAGLALDSMGLGCSAISTVLCGDGELAAPETCDDGNLIQGDGCSRRCQLE